MNGKNLTFTLIDDEPKQTSAKDMAFSAIAFVLICGAWVLLVESMFPGSWPITVLFFAHIPICMFIAEATQKHRGTH